MKDDVTIDTVTKQIQLFRNDLVQTRSVLENKDSVRLLKSLETDISIKLENLKNQVNDPLRLGCGT